MPTIKDKLYFNFDGKSSRDFKLLSVVMDNGMYEETMVSSRDINETEIRGSSKPMLNSIKDTPLQFELTLAFEQAYTDDDIDAIIRWLFVDNYRPLYFEEKEDKVYMCLPVDDTKIVHNGLREGYFTITMRCDSSNVYSPVVTSESVTVSADTSSTIIVPNHGHFEIYPEISLKKNGAGTIVIESLDDNGNIFEIRDLTDQEDIYINCEKEIIQTDLIGTYRYDKLIGDFPRLVYGDNRFKVTGACTIQFRYKNRYRF
ncbi:phage tail family protein [Bacillus subtilis]|uniref:Distal tail protein n=1 Tax=Bacillus phage vB_BsuS_PJN02 TaxID=2920374 RepID=A0AC61TRT0_9CAUD|nr:MULTISPECIES: phage tail domain-containing protein [Bacillus subtilis group]YP_010681670.1 distal tail protein [Bacillus phage vB_BsuS_PJN02]MCR4361980.1 phage tail family protein [Bacillus subtilis]UNH58395.1 distal tail protein [Bacillus phage vB_BsuS_PJN02]UQB84203.1 phage tail family protein [Bacillus amyloliquefaciens]WOF33039.1 phage tail family protein [Bacillus subtilis]